MYAIAQIDAATGASVWPALLFVLNGFWRYAKSTEGSSFRDLSISGFTLLYAMPMAAMPVPNDLSTRNRILSMLSGPEYLRLRPSLEHVGLSASTVLYAPGDVVRHIYFPNDAVVSLLCDVDEHRTVEVAMEGNESAVGFASYLAGMRAPNLSVVRDGGTAMRLDAGALRRCVGHSELLSDLLYRSVHALVMQIAQSGVCNRFHSIEARVARWMMMTRDRVGSCEFHATQESIARMLGIRRSGVTAAAFGLRKRCLIGYCRGRIQIMDEAGLRAACCPCYGTIKRQYDGFLT